MTLALPLPAGADPELWALLCGLSTDNLRDEYLYLTRLCRNWSGSTADCRRLATVRQALKERGIAEPSEAEAKAEPAPGAPLGPAQDPQPAQAKRMTRCQSCRAGAACVWLKPKREERW